LQYTVRTSVLNKQKKTEAKDRFLILIEDNWEFDFILLYFTKMHLIYFEKLFWRQNWVLWCYDRLNCPKRCYDSQRFIIKLHSHSHIHCTMHSTESHDSYVTTIYKLST